MIDVMPIEKSNLNDLVIENPERGGWFIGKFMPNDSLLNSDSCEVKWMNHPKGTRRESGVDLSVKSRTVVALISGKWGMKLQGQEIVLEKAGDCVVFESEPHTSYALEDSTVLAIRWFL